MSKFEIATISNKIITVDLSELTNKENLYFNATEIAKQFDTEVRKYLNNQKVKEYIEARLIQLNSGTPKWAYEDLIKTTKGGKYQGTWLHNSLAIDFARWVNPAFAVQLDDYILNKIKNEKIRKCERSLAKLEYPLMTDAIKENLLAGKDSDKWQYNIEADIINKIVLGKKAKQYCIENNIDRTCLRDSLPPKQIEIIHKLQEINTVLINVGIPRGERIEKLITQYYKLIQKLLN